MEALDDAVGLRPLHAGLAVLDALELEEQLVGMAVHAAAELAAVVGQHGVHFDAMRLEGRQHVGVKQMHGGDRHLVGVEATPTIARAAVDRALQVDLADALEVTDEEGVDSHQIAGVAGLDMALAELRTEAFQRLDLLL